MMLVGDLVKYKLWYRNGDKGVWLVVGVEIDKNSGKNFPTFTTENKRTI